jgi:hypothetical protein
MENPFSTLAAIKQASGTPGASGTAEAPARDGTLLSTLSTCVHLAELCHDRLRDVTTNLAGEPADRGLPPYDCNVKSTLEALQAKLSDLADRLALVQEIVR